MWKPGIARMEKKSQKFHYVDKSDGVTVETKRGKGESAIALGEYKEVGFS